MRKIVFVLMLVTIVVLSCGCGVTNEATMTTEGKGTVSFRIGFKKGSIGDTGYIRYDTIDELASKIEELIDDETGLKVTTDTKTNEKEDYILVSYEYENIEDYKSNMDIVVQKYNELVESEDINDLFLFEPYAMNLANEWECEALAEYLEENGIAADSHDRYVRKFIKLLVKDMYIGGEMEYDSEHELEYERSMKKQGQKEYDYSSDNEFVVLPGVDIIENSGDKYLKIKSFAIGYIDMYIRKLLDKNAEIIFDTEYMKEKSVYINGQEVKEIFKNTLESADLATDIKKAIDEKIGTDNIEYSMKDFSPVMLVKLLTEDYVKAVNKAYNKEYNAFQDLKSESYYEQEVDMIAELYNERDTKYEIVFGENKAVVDSENMYDYMDDDGYFTLSEKKGAGLEIKEHNNVAYENLDEAPESGDNRNIVACVIIALVAISMMIIVSRKKYHVC